MKFTLDLLHGFLGLPQDWDLIGNHWPSDSSHQTHDLLKICKPDVQSDMWKWADRFVSHVQDHKLPDEPRVLVGYSLGGRLALHALLRAPKLWSAAILISTHTGLEHTSEKQQRVTQDHEWARRFEQERWDLLMSAWNAKEVFAGDRFHFNRDEKNYERSDLANALRFWSLGKQDYVADRIEEQKIPILWIAGEKDPKFAQHAVTRANKWIASDCGHRVPWDKPVEFQHKIRDFLASI